LILLAGPATRLFEHLHGVPKVYEATVRWGVETDNGDLHGKVVTTGDVSGLSVQQVEDALATFVGWHEQVPPATSAKRVGGERAYVRAHRGEHVVMPSQRVYLHEARWLSHDLPRESRLRMVVRGGYYVRALARDLGRSVGCGAHLTALHRTAIASWADPGEGKSMEVRGREIMPWAPVRELTDAEVGELRKDRGIALGEVVPGEWKVPVAFPDPEAPVRGMHLGRLLYMLRAADGGLRVRSALGAGL
jgi:tRNA pseudouridine55 synthase